MFQFFVDRGGVWGWRIVPKLKKTQKFFRILNVIQNLRLFLNNFVILLIFRFFVERGVLKSKKLQNFVRVPKTMQFLRLFFIKKKFWGF